MSWYQLKSIFLEVKGKLWLIACVQLLLLCLCDRIFMFTLVSQTSVVCIWGPEMCSV